MKQNNFLPALATMVGTVIGAGFLGIPYVVGKAGLIPGVVWLLILSGFMLLVNLYLGEVILRTKGEHQLTGYAKLYTGKIGKLIMFFSMVFGIFSALVAYMIGEGRSLSYLLFGHFDYSLVFSILFWVFLSYLTFIGIRALKNYEKISMFIVLFLFVLIILFFMGRVRVENLNYVDTKYLFLPFGVILFSLLGFSALPEVERILKGQEKLWKKVLLYAALIPFIAYLVFMFVTVGSFGPTINEVATLSLGRFFTFLGVMTMFTAYFALSMAIQDMFRFDFYYNKKEAWVISSIIPLLLFFIVRLTGYESFAAILGISGIVAGGTSGILALVMNIRAKKLGDKKPEYKIPINWIIIGILSLLFIAAVVMELFY